MKGIQISVRGGRTGMSFLASEIFLLLTSVVNLRPVKDHRPFTSHLNTTERSESLTVSEIYVNRLLG